MPTSQKRDMGHPCLWRWLVWRWAEATLGRAGGRGWIDGSYKMGLHAGRRVSWLQELQSGNLRVAVLAVVDTVFGDCGAVDLVARVWLVFHELRGDFLGKEDLANV